jgi:hypothetical protein
MIAIALPAAIVFWIVCAMSATVYFERLFAELRFGWTPRNRACVHLLCLAGPAALVCGLVVDATRPAAISGRY